MLLEQVLALLQPLQSALLEAKLHQKGAVPCVQGKAVDDFTEIPRDRLEKTFLVNIVGMISLAQKALPHMKPGSAIINVRWNSNMLPYGISCLHACLWVSIQ